MLKKSSILIIFITVLVLSGCSWKFWEGEAKKEDQQKEEQEQKRDEVQNPDQGQKVKQEFVIDVDPNVDHWQTKETEFFTIKFPKEWYWSGSVITNNPDFDIVKYADIGVFSGIGPHPPLMLSDNAEVVMTHWGTPTSNAGTPQDSIDAIFDLAKRNNPSVDCSVSNNKTIPFTAYCVATYDSQLQRSYYVINNEISLTITIRTTKDNPIKNEILDKIIGSIILK